MTEGAPEFPAISLETVTAQLQGCPHLKKDSIAITVESKDNTDLATSLWITWTLTGLKVTPNENPYYNLNKGEVFAIPLPNITINANLCTGNIYVKSENGDGMRKTPFTIHCHPHIMRDARPCFGDFELAVFQTMESGDITALNDILVVYLSQATNTDTAGKTWPYFLPNNILRDLSRETEQFAITGPFDHLIVQQLPCLHVTEDGELKIVYKLRGVHVATGIPDREFDIVNPDVNDILNTMVKFGMEYPQWLRKHLEDNQAEDTTIPADATFFGR
jgi:hypothetical protein